MLVEWIPSQDAPLAALVRAGHDPNETTFVTPDELQLQVGFVVYPRGGAVVPHSHKPLERRLVGTSEVILVRSGRCELDLYDDGSLIATRELEPGDLVLLVAGGHGLRMLEDTVLLEVKQGPYTGLAEKEPIA